MAEPVGTVPEFTSDEGAEAVEEVKKIEGEPEGEPEIEETDTPAELPAAEPDGEEQKAIRGLTKERAKLLKEISDLKGTRRELKQEKLATVEAKIEELEGVAPEDINLVERVLKAKGYITKSDADQMTYERTKEAQTEAFLDKYPEYKPENDPGDTNWNLLQRELAFFRLPTDPKLIGEVLERAHRGIVKAPTANITAQKRQVATAALGSGGNTQKSPQKNTITDSMREVYRRGGWSEEEIDKMSQ